MIRHAHSPTSKLTKVLGLVLAGISTACATSSPGLMSRTDAAPAATVVVRNASFDDVRVYLVRGSSRHSLGIVGAAATEGLPVPDSWVDAEPVEIVAVPRISSGPTRSTGFVQLYSGDTVDWAIDNNRAVHSLRRR